MYQNAGFAALIYLMTTALNRPDLGELRLGDVPMVLMYHVIDEASDDPHRLAVAPARFAEQMAWLAGTPPGRRHRPAGRDHRCQGGAYLDWARLKDSLRIFGDTSGVDQEPSISGSSSYHGPPSRAPITSGASSRASAAAIS
jgi:hypothetical protein